MLKLAPGWLLFSLAGFVLVFLLFGWLSHLLVRKGDAEEELRNEALSATYASRPTLDARRAAKDSVQPVQTPSTAAAPSMETRTEDAQASPFQQEEPRVAENDAQFAVQTGSFDDRSQANEQVSRLRVAGFDTRIVEKQKDKGEGVWYQVRCGRFATREEAAQLAAQLRSKRLIGKAVIVEPMRE